MTVLTILIAAGALAYLGLIILAIAVGPRLLFPIPAPSYPPSPDFPQIFLPNRTEIRTLYLPVQGADRLILYHHGNGEDLGTLRPRMEAFREHGYAAFSYDYPGYGHSTGRPTESSVLAAAEAAHRHLLDVHGWDPAVVVHYGHSLGGGPAIFMGTRAPACGVVVEGAFTGVSRLITRRRILPWETFNNLGRVRHLQSPLLVLHGTADSTVPWWCGRELLSHAPAGSGHLWIEGAHHADLWETAGERLWEALHDFTSRQKQA